MFEKLLIYIPYPVTTYATPSPHVYQIIRETSKPHKEAPYVKCA